MLHWIILKDWVQLDRLCWGYLSKNPAAIHLLEANLDKICWLWLSLNPAIFTVKIKQHMLELGIAEGIIADD